MKASFNFSAVVPGRASMARVVYESGNMETVQADEGQCFRIRATYEDDFPTEVQFLSPNNTVIQVQAVSPTDIFEDDPESSEPTDVDGNERAADSDDAEHAAGQELERVQSVEPAQEGDVRGLSGSV